MLRKGTVWITHFKHRIFHKYTRVAKGQDGVGIQRITDLVLVKRNRL